MRRNKTGRGGRNLCTGLKRRRRVSPMRTYDSLPPELRCWLAAACLPWSPASALKIWNRSGGSTDIAGALSRLDAIERSMLQKDAGIWHMKDTRVAGN